ncbi:sodium ion-translocating decarboxylase subunit beta [Deferribacterales bacterium RsTz2092]|nr:oxaloacetate decarboxylase subunit beta [Deferribacterales bacterium]
MDMVETLLTALFSQGAFANATPGKLIMIIVGIVFIVLAVRKNYEPFLLVPIGFGIIVGNIPFQEGLDVGIYEPGTVFNTFFQGVMKGLYPPIIFLGVGAMTDFSAMLSNPKLIMLGAAAQLGIFTTFCLGVGILPSIFASDPTLMKGIVDAVQVGPDGVSAVYNASDITASVIAEASQKLSAAIGIIGGADGPTSIFVASKLAPTYLGAIAVAGYSYMALIPVVQPPVVHMLTTKSQRLRQMKARPPVSKRMLMIFPVMGFILTSSLAPGALPLLGMLFFGNFLKECGVTDRLGKTACNALLDIITIVLGMSVGMSTDASRFLTPVSLAIFGMGAAAFAFSTAGGVLFAHIMNLFLPEDEKVNPIIGAAGVSAVPGAARVAHVIGTTEDPSNFLITHAMAPNVAGVIGSAVAAGIFLSM